MKFEVKNRFTGKVQFIAEIECDESASRSVKLGLAVKWAVRTDANLGGADLWNADLISLGSRSDGYDFYAQIKDGETWIKAGCRYFSATDARKHWSDTRGGTALGDESQAMIDHAERMVAIRGLMEKSK